MPSRDQQHGFRDVAIGPSMLRNGRLSRRWSVLPGLHDPCRQIFVVDVTIKILSIIATLFSPLFLLRIKIALTSTAPRNSSAPLWSMESRGSGTTSSGYRRDSWSTWMIVRRSPSPEPCSGFVCHAYGEGRCCIHWWREWRHQPAVCRESALCRRCWLVLCRIFGVLIVYPAIIYGSLALYAPKILQYRSLVNYTQHSEMLNPVELDINVIVRTALTTSTYEIATSVWILFSFCAFLYAVTILSWPNHPLERCLMRYEGKRPSDQPNALYRRISQSYKSVLLDLAYGRYRTKRHFFRIRCLPWGFRRVCHFVLAVLSQVPVVNICFTTFMYDAKIFDTEAADQAATDHDEAVDKLPVSRPSGRMVGKLILASIVWIGFVSILAGFCTTVYLMIQFLFNVGFFVIIGIAINATSILPWICFAVVTLLYLNDLLTEINAEHRAILKLIDENSPRISAVEEPDESAFRADAATSGGSGIQILKTHNLGAVKFIDGDNCEFVSKELYYNVCADLRCGWSRSVRRILNRMALVVPFLAFLFVTLWALSSFIGSNAIFWIISLIGSGIPKLIEIYTNSKSANRMWNPSGPRSYRIYWTGTSGSIDPSSRWTRWRRNWWPTTSARSVSWRSTIRGRRSWGPSVCGSFHGTSPAINRPSPRNRSSWPSPTNCPLLPSSDGSSPESTRATLTTTLCSGSGVWWSRLAL